MLALYQAGNELTAWYRQPDEADRRVCRDIADRTERRETVIVRVTAHDTRCCRRMAGSAAPSGAPKAKRPSGARRNWPGGRGNFGLNVSLSSLGRLQGGRKSPKSRRYLNYLWL